MSEKSKRLEALLFMTGEAVSIKELGKVLSISADEVASLIQEVSKSLRDHGLAIVETADRVQIVTSPDVADFLTEYAHRDEKELSRAASETLAIIAYRGPISRYDVDLLRGVDSRRMVRQLIRRGVVAQLRQSGRVPKYDVTEEFLQHVGIERRELLPDFDSLSTAEAIERLLDHEESSS